MPLGFQRLNERTKRPNELINFIRPLIGQDEAKSQAYLERIAAIVYPIMKANHIVVMALEEYPSNPEFWGRNFNAGEVIQLVLKSRNGSWLPFKHVQMVMIHELAHCKQMNHSKFFWQVRNSYSDKLRALWFKNYTGEGLWGTGRGLEDGAYLRNDMPDSQFLPDSLCGGVYRNKGKRKRGRKSTKPEMSYAERKQRRILKKFGAGGTALGADEDERSKLENGKKVKGKPRVAGSNRARELRAAAALARFDKAKAETVKTEVKEEDGSETESDYAWSDVEDDQAQVLKTDGKEFVKVCDDEDENDPNVKLEMEEMMSSLQEIPELRSTATESHHDHRPKKKTLESKSVPTPKTSTSPAMEKSKPLTKGSNSFVNTNPTTKMRDENISCSICSFENEPKASICMACSNVLDPSTVWDHWRCQSNSCNNSSYINSGDYGRCQLCGQKKT